jgi:phosphoribosyl 1,2-cyclic phosphodiesterase
MVKTKKEKRGVDFIKFLGTSGARFVMIKQLRASGGIWVSSGGTNVLIDPGPGSIVRCAASKPRLDPSTLDAIILTHRHLDHSGDINVMIEAMTEGGFKKRGIVFCPSDALSFDPVILKYALGFPQEIKIIEPDKTYRVGNFEFETSMKHIHPVQTFGLKFDLSGTSVSLLTDTRYFRELESFYKTDMVIFFVVFVEPRQGVDHLSLQEASELICALRPKKAILTHFGMQMLNAKPHLLAKKIAHDSGVEVIAAYDGMRLEFS